MPSAEIITIGTEILLGEIIDTNSSYLARQLRDNGVDVYRTTSIGDNVERIATAVREALQRADIVITTGGLGPTVDDPTREAVARAFGVETKYHEALWEQVCERFARFGRIPTENNQRQAYLPAGATPIENPVGTAPAFLVETGGEGRNSVLIALPGVPREMEHLLAHEALPRLRKRYNLSGVLKVRILHTAGVGESQIDARIGDLETLTNPTVGLAAHSGQVDVRITAKAETHGKATALIQKTEDEIRQRLGRWVYGADEETLEGLTLRMLAEKGWRLVVVEAGLEGKLVRRFANDTATFLWGEVHPTPPEDPAELLPLTARVCQQRHAEVGLGVAIYRAPVKSVVYLALVSPEGQKQRRLSYGGPPKLAHRHAVNAGLDLLRKLESST